MHVKIPFGMRLAIRRGLVKAGRIGKRAVKKIIVAGREAFQDLGQRVFFGCVHFGKARNPMTAKHQCRERPYRPKRHQGDEVRVVAYDPLTLFHLRLEALAEQGGVLAFQVPLHIRQFLGRFVERAILQRGERESKSYARFDGKPHIPFGDALSLNEDWFCRIRALSRRAEVRSGFNR